MTEKAAVVGPKRNWRKIRATVLDVLSWGCLIATLIVLVFAADYVGLQAPNAEKPAMTLAFFAMCPSVIAVVLIMRQIYIGKTELDIVEAQGVLMQRQEERLSRRAELVAWITLGLEPNLLGHAQWPRICIGNIGDRSAHGVTIEIFLPQGVNFTGMMEQDAWFSKKVTIGGIERERILKHLNTVFYARRGLTDIASFPAVAPGPIAGQMEYCLLYDDGTTPASGQWNPLVVEPLDAVTFLPKRFVPIQIG